MDMYREMIQNPEPDTDPPEDFYVQADCGHEVYEGETPVSYTHLLSVACPIRSCMYLFGTPRASPTEACACLKSWKRYDCERLSSAHKRLNRLYMACPDRVTRYGLPVLFFSINSVIYSEITILRVLEVVFVCFSTAFPSTSTMARRTYIIFPCISSGFKPLISDIRKPHHTASITGSSIGVFCTPCIIAFKSSVVGIA